MSFLVGVLVGFVISLFYNILSKTYGTIYVDHEKNICNVHITSEDLVNRKTTKAVFKVYHSDKVVKNTEINFSRNEHSL